MLLHYLVKNNLFDAASQIVDHTHNTSTGSCTATHLFLKNTVINPIDWKLQTRHKVDRGDMDTYFVMYRWSKTYDYNNCYTLQTKLLLHLQLMRRHFSGDVCEFIILWCNISSGFCTPKIIKNTFIFRRVIQNIGGHFWDTVWYLAPCYSTTV